MPDLMADYKFTEETFDDLFIEFDTDKSGKIDREEMTRFMMRIMNDGQVVDAKQIGKKLYPPFNKYNKGQNGHTTFNNSALMQFDSVLANTYGSLEILSPSKKKGDKRARKFAKH